MNSQKESLKLHVDNVLLEGELIVPRHATCLVVFSHGSGSSRFSPRNNFVAQQLHRRGIATFLFDLLTQEEDEVYANRFNIELLSNRLIDVTKALMKLQAVKPLPIGYFGASTGAASALIAATHPVNRIRAVVSRGGRPDLAGDHLYLVKCPTLLIIGSLDHDVMQLNRQAFENMPCIKALSEVKGATHLFEEDGALEQVAELSANWFDRYLAGKEQPAEKKQVIAK